MIFQRYQQTTQRIREISQTSSFRVCKLLQFAILKFLWPRSSGPLANYCTYNLSLTGVHVHLTFLHYHRNILACCKRRIVTVPSLVGRTKTLPHVAFYSTHMHVVKPQTYPWEQQLNEYNDSAIGYLFGRRCRLRELAADLQVSSPSTI